MRTPTPRGCYPLAVLGTSEGYAIPERKHSVKAGRRPTLYVSQYVPQHTRPAPVGPCRILGDASETRQAGFSI
jgi:hypothetical protein